MVFHKKNEEVATDPINNKRWTRRNLIGLWDGQPYTTPEERTANMAECDRIFIALHRFQTNGKVAYCQLIGMHGGGGGTSDDTFCNLLSVTQITMVIILAMVTGQTLYLMPLLLFALRKMTIIAAFHTLFVSTHSLNF